MALEKVRRTSGNLRRWAARNGIYTTQQVTQSASGFTITTRCQAPEYAFPVPMIYQQTVFTRYPNDVDATIFTQDHVCLVQLAGKYNDLVDALELEKSRDEAGRTEQAD